MGEAAGDDTGAAGASSCSQSGLAAAVTSPIGAAIGGSGSACEGIHSRAQRAQRTVCPGFSRGIGT